MGGSPVGDGAQTGNERRNMGTTRKIWAALAVLVLAFALAGCSDGGGLDDERGIGSDERRDGERGDEGRVEEGRRGDDGETRVGGFSVRGPDGEEITIPEAEVDQEDVEEYIGFVSPTLDESTRDFSSLVDSGASLQGSTASLSVSAESVEEALKANEESFESMQDMDIPGDLGDIHDELVDSRERAISAYNGINQAFVNDGDSGDVSDAIEDSLPEIEHSTFETRAILQELERAGSRETR